MTFDSTSLLAAIAIGVGATLSMDLWNLFLKRAFGIASLDYRLLGRWVGHLTSGRIAHEHIARAAPLRAEHAIGWIAHYSIGIVLALAFIFIASSAWLARPTVTPALAFGIATVVFPYFVLQPSLGFGIASSRAPRPAQARLKSLVTHTVFGLGLYLTALVVTALN